MPIRDLRTEQFRPRADQSAQSLTSTQSTKNAPTDHDGRTTRRALQQNQIYPMDTQERTALSSKQRSSLGTDATSTTAAPEATGRPPMPKTMSPRFQLLAQKPQSQAIPKEKRESGDTTTQINEEKKDPFPTVDLLKILNSQLSGSGITQMASKSH